MRAAAPLSAAPQPSSRGPGAPDDSLGSRVHHLARSLKQQWKRYRKELKRCQRKCSAKAIHSFRIESRRLLSSLELLDGFLPARQTEKAQHLLKRHLDIFDDLRDTQVQLAVVGGMRRAFSAARPFLAWLRAWEERFARKTRKNIRKVKTARLGKLIAVCRGEVEERLGKSTPREALAALLRSVDRAFGRTRQLRTRIDARDTLTIHRTRVAFKRFRYMVETMTEHLPAVTRERLSAMRHYQTMMGEIQDAEMRLRALDKFLRKQETELAAAHRFRTELLRRRQRLIRVYLKTADQLLEFWSLPDSRAGVPPAPRGSLARESRAGISAES
jgi:CHAD domain-containing protein